MFGSLVLLYLFLGGTGAGALFVSCLLGILGSRPVQNLAPHIGVHGAALRSTLNLTFLLGFGCLCAGVVCLMADIGRYDRILTLFVHPRPTALTVGAFVLVLMLALAGFLTASRYLRIPYVNAQHVFLAECAALPTALVTMAYTGVLLQELGGVAFWDSPLVPALFVLSSLSCGAAAFFAMAPFSGTEDRFQHRVLALLARFDVAVIVLELICAAALCLGAAHSGRASAADSLHALTSGAHAVLWWLGFVGCGVLAPLALELAAARTNRLRNLLATAAVLVLVGGACMRWAIVESGTYPSLELQSARPGLSLSNDVRNNP